MRLFSPLSSFIFLLASAAAFGQITPVAAPGCADLHLVPAPRECVSVETIPIGGVGFFEISVGKRCCFWTDYAGCGARLRGLAPGSCAPGVCLCRDDSHWRCGFF